jgi:hypothetical protein
VTQNNEPIRRRSFSNDIDLFVTVLTPCIVSQPSPFIAFFFLQGNEIEFTICALLTISNLEIFSNSNRQILVFNFIVICVKISQIIIRLKVNL